MEAPISLDPNNNLQRIISRLEANRLQEAISLCRALLRNDPNQAQTLHLLGFALLRRRKLNEAIRTLDRAVQLEPERSDIANTQGTAYACNEDHLSAIKSFRRALRINPKYAEAWNNLGTSLSRLHKYPEAIIAYRNATQYRPRYAAAYNHLGLALRKAGDTAAAIQAHLQALAFAPSLAEAHHGLAESYLQDGDAERAVAAFREACAQQPENPSYRSDLIFAIHYLRDVSPSEIYAEHQEWARRFEQPLADKPFRNDRSPGRRLRIGYVSPDFREHSCVRFIRPLMSFHDHSQFEIFCYSDVQKPDQITKELIPLADRWQDTSTLSSAEFASRVESNQIDILVDLAGHMAGNRLVVFANRAAPIQLTYRGYANTTGLRRMDYCLTDADRDPVGVADPFYSETLLRIPGTSQCYSPTDEDLDVAPLPCLSQGVFSFGSFNRSAKHTPEVIELWSQLLHSLPNSRLVLLGPGGGDYSRYALGTFARFGIDRQRLDIRPFCMRREYLRMFDCLDLMLDPFPYNGHTTSLDGLWMGVPFITLEGNSCVSRIGLSLLRSLGLDSFVVQTKEQYLETATSLAKSPSILEELRPRLRSKLKDSPLMDGPGHVRNVEATFRAIWHAWVSRSS